MVAVLGAGFVLSVHADLADHAAAERALHRTWTKVSKCCRRVKQGCVCVRGDQV